MKCSIIGLRNFLIIFCMTCILCENAVRVLFNNNTLIVPVCMIMVILIVLLHKKKILIKTNINKLVYILAIFMMELYMIISMIIYGFNETFLKINLYIILAFSITNISEKVINQTLTIVEIVSVIYSYYIIINAAIFSSIFSGIEGRLNYINIGMVSSFGIVLLFSDLVVNFKKHSLFFKILIIIGIVINTTAVLSYSSVGNLIIPFVSLIVTFICSEIKRNNLKEILNGRLLLFVIIATVLLMFLHSIAIQYDVYDKFLNILRDRGVSSRVNLWINYTSKIIEKKGYFWGIGFRQSLAVTGMGYPHNFVLELWGEMGIVGLFVLAVFSIGIIAKLERKSAIINFDFKILSCLLFYAFNYSKSFSVYMGFNFFIFIAMWLRENKHIKGGIYENCIHNIDI